MLVQSESLVRSVENWLETELELLGGQQIGEHKVSALISSESDPRETLKQAIEFLASNSRPQPKFQVGKDKIQFTHSDVLETWHRKLKFLPHVLHERKSPKNSYLSQKNKFII